MTNTASLRTKAGRRASLLAGVLVGALLATGADAQAATRPTAESAGLNAPSTYGIDWTDVPTEPTKTVVKVPTAIPTRRRSSPNARLAFTTEPTRP